MSAAALYAPGAPRGAAVGAGPFGDVRGGAPLGVLLHQHTPAAPGSPGTPVPYPAYERHLRALARRGRTGGGALGELVVHAARRAADLLRECHETSGGAHGYVCAAVPVRLAHDPRAVRAGARALRDAVGRPNLMIRVPATDPGLAAITACLAEGIGVHAGPVVSLERYARLTDALLTGWERAAAAGHDLAAVPVAVSLPVRGLDIGGGQGTGPAGRSPAAATVQLAHRMREEIHQGPRWRALARQGAHPHRLLWDPVAGTSPQERSAAGAGAGADAGPVPGARPGPGFGEDPAWAWRVLEELSRHGVCYRTLAADAERAALARAARQERSVARTVAAALAEAATGH
ncbi:transaldolase family protein [Streptomyces sp. NPDC004065]|uniref:transaldolase family protein n=1 Tax=Streptomyces sp. NPDC004065 TaxID=3364689 RepID=UPI00384E1760